MEATRRDRFDPDFVGAILPGVLVVLLLAVTKWCVEELSAGPATFPPMESSPGASFTHFTTWEVPSEFNSGNWRVILGPGSPWTAWGGVAVAVALLLIADRSRRGFGSPAAQRAARRSTGPRRILHLRPVRAISRVARWRERPGIVETSLAFLLPILLAVFAWGAFRLTVSPGDRPCAVPTKRYTAF